MTARTPNIIFLLADQWPASAVGCYGSGVDSTPTLDALARAGRRFTRCYDTVPLCGPNRACLLTGRSPEINGVTHNNLFLSPTVPTYAHLLREAGYRTGGFGKFHTTPMGLPLPRDMRHLGFAECAITEDPRVGPWLDWIEREHPDQYRRALAVTWPVPWAKSYGPDKRNLIPLIESAYREFVLPMLKDRPWSLTYTSPLPKELHQTTWITDRALEFMARHADQSFLCKVSYVDPHDPYDPPEPYASMFRPEDMPDPIPAAWEQEGSRTLSEAQRFHGFEKIAHDVRALKELRALYYGKLRFIDDQIARIVRFLDERKLWHNTIVVFTTDHGDMLGDHALITKGVKHFDAGIRCPLIVRGAGIAPGVDERLVCSLDFIPTFCDWAGIEARPPLEGKSFAADGPGWDEVTVQMIGVPGSIENVRSIVTDDGWRLTYFAADNRWEMFDLRNDPTEQRNLARGALMTARRWELVDRFTRAYMRPAQTHQFRNQTVWGGRRWDHDGGFTARPAAWQGLDVFAGVNLSEP
jgi:arylsulfatase